MNPRSASLADSDVERRSREISWSAWSVAGDGLLLWGAYGVLEGVLALAVPGALGLHKGPVPLSPALTIVLPLAYAAVGALLSGAVALLVQRFVQSAGARRWKLLAGWQGPSDPSLLAISTLLLATVAELVGRSGPGVPEAWGSCGLLLVLTTGSLVSEQVARRLHFATRPLCVLGLLLAVPWAAAAAPPGGLHRRVLLGGAALVLVLGVSALLGRLWGRADGRGGLWSRRSLAAVAAIALLGSLGSFREERPEIREVTRVLPAPDPSRPNVVLVVMDTVRADHLSLYGYGRRTSPSLEALAKHATLYENAISAGSMTLSTHASIFTGLYPRRHGAHYDLPRYPGGRRLPDRFPTLAEILSRHGYVSLGVAANYGYLGPGFGLDRGFDYYDSRTATPLLRSTMPFTLRDGATDILGRFLPPCARDRTTRRAADVDAEAFQLVDRYRGRPFFLFLNYMDAHSPYCPPPPYDTLFPGKLDRFSNRDYVKLEADVLSGRRQVPAAVRADLVSQYDGGIAYLDHEIGRLVDRLRKRGLLDSTLLIVTADHGEAFGERSLIEHGVSVYQNQVHVPLLIHFPGEARGRVVRADVSSVDLLPTVLDVAGIRTPAGLSGVSLRDGAALRDRDVIAESYPNGYLVRYSPRFRRVSRAILRGPLKLIVTTAGRSSLFDLSRDPDEAHDLLREGRKAPALRAQLARWLAHTKPSANPAALDPATLQRLRELGYVE